MLQKILGAMDILIGLLLIAGPEWNILKIIGIISIAKGLWSTFSSALFGFFFDWMGWIDTLSGISLILISNGYSIFLFKIFGFGIIVKGILSVFS